MFFSRIRLNLDEATLSARHIDFEESLAGLRPRKTSFNPLRSVCRFLQLDR